MKQLFIDRLKDYTSRKFIAFIFITILAFVLIKDGNITDLWAQVLSLLGPFALYVISNVIDRFENLKFSGGGVTIEAEDKPIADAIGQEVEHDPNASDDEEEFPSEMPIKKTPEEKKVGFR